MKVHWTRTKSALSFAVAVLLFFVSMSPQDAIGNLKKAVEFIGFGVPPWFAAASLGAFARPLVAIAAIGFLLWAFWPSRKPTPPELEAAPNPILPPDPMEKVAAAMVDAQRPWIALDLAPVGALAFDDEGWGAGPRWHIPVRYSVKNTGPTVANNVDVFGAIVASVANHFTDTHPNGLPVWPMTPGTDLEALIEEVCSFPEHIRMHSVEHGFKTGRDLPPGHGFDGVLNFNGNPEKFKPSKGYTGQFQIVMAATYTSPLIAGPLRTAKVFHLFKAQGNIDLAGEVVPLGELRMVLNPVIPGYSR